MRVYDVERMEISNYFAFATIIVSVQPVLVEMLKNGILYNRSAQFLFLCYILSLFVMLPISEYKRKQSEKIIKENKIDVIE